MKNLRDNLIAVTFFMFLISILFINGCKQDENGGGGGSSSNNDLGSQYGITPAFSGKASLLTQKDVLSSARISTRSHRGKELFTYHLEPNRASRSAAAEESGTNLLAVDENGNATLAFDSSLPIKVMYTVADPQGEYVYVALDNGWWGCNDGGSCSGDYQQVIVQTECAFFQIKVEDNSMNCLVGGYRLQSMDSNYMKAISNDAKPIQFDENGNVYFSASTFTIKGKDDCEGCGWVEDNTWRAIVYKYDKSTKGITQITQDTDNLQFFLTIPSGEIVFKTWGNSGGSGDLKMWRTNGSVVTLSDNGWGVDFFSVDTDTTAIWGGWSDQGAIRFAKPRGAGGTYRASMNTSLFGENNNNNPTPRRVIIGDDGGVYAAFDSGKSVYNESTSSWDWVQQLKFYKILPYDAVPKAELDLGDDGWWGWMSETTFQVSRGYLYYTEKYEDPYYGDIDFIKLIRLRDKESTILLKSTTSEIDDGAPYYDIYNWRLSGTDLYFSALDQSRNVVVTGKIDTQKVASGSPKSEYLSINDTAQASGAVSRINDIEVIKPTVISYEAGYPVPTVYSDPDNLYSISIDFSKYMNNDDVLDKVKILDSANSDVDYMPVWAYKSLHMIPDTSTDGLGDTVDGALATNASYTISIPAGTKDNSGFEVQSNSNTTLDTRPEHGWYVSSASAGTSTISTGNVASFAGPKTDNEKQTYKLYDNISGNVRIEFSAINKAWEGITFIDWNQTYYDSNSSQWSSQEFSFRINSWFDGRIVKNNSRQTEWFNGNAYSKFMNGNWKKYRLDIYGTNLVVSSSDDGTDYDTVKEISNLRDRSNTSGEHHILLMSVRQRLLMDNLRIVKLTNSGSETGSDLLSVNFDSGSPLDDAGLNQRTDNNSSLDYKNL